MKNIKIFIFILYFIIFSQSMYAGEYYKYINENGVVSFTDDISKIPKEQRNKIEVTKTLNNKSSDKQEDSSIKEAEEAGTDADADKNLENELQQLKKIKAELDKESSEINRESIKLIEEKKLIKENKDIKEYNIKIEALNKKTNIYQAKQVEYLKRVNAYNIKAAEQ